MIRPPWTPEIEVAPDLAADLIGTQFPALADLPVAEMATGWDNTVYLVGGQWVFRFPRRQVAVGATGREIAALPKLAAVLPLPVPVPEFAGRSTDRYPWPFWGARLLSGVELADSGLTDDQRGPAGRAVGQFLRALHDPALIDWLGVPLPADPTRRNDVVWRASWAREIIGRLAAGHIWQPDSDVLDLLGRAERITAPDSPVRTDGPASAASAGGLGGVVSPGGAGPGAVLCHGDLNVRHLLVDEAGRAAGVIDWGDLCLADPAIDLSIAYAGFAGQPRAELFAAYGGPPEPDRELRARVLAVFLSAALAEYAFTEHRSRLLTESLSGLRRAVSG